MNHLEVKSLTFDRGNFSLRSSLSLERGTTGVILGPSGCGKTTLLRCLAGLEQQSGGTISINGREIGNLPTEKRNIGFVFQDLALFDHLSGRDNINFGLKLKNIRLQEADARIDALADKLQIGSLLNRKPYAMSGGERQRLAFARALACQPDLLLLDEPLSSLDAPLRRELRAYLKRTLSLEGTTALHVTHDVEEALELGDKIFLMNGGRILVSGPPKLLYENPPDAWCARFLGLGSLLPINSVEPTGNRIMAKTDFGSFFLPFPEQRCQHRNVSPGKSIFFLPKAGCKVRQKKREAQRMYLAARTSWKRPSSAVSSWATLSGSYFVPCLPKELLLQPHLMVRILFSKSRATVPSRLRPGKKSAWKSMPRCAEFCLYIDKLIKTRRFPWFQRFSRPKP